MLFSEPPPYFRKATLLTLHVTGTPSIKRVPDCAGHAQSWRQAEAPNRSLSTELDKQQKHPGHVCSREWASIPGLLRSRWDLSTLDHVATNLHKSGLAIHKEQAGPGTAMDPTPFHTGRDAPTVMGALPIHTCVAGMGRSALKEPALVWHTHLRAGFSCFVSQGLCGHYGESKK